MNKYQEALNRITKTAVKNETLQSDLECFYKLQELVNKETPIKPKSFNDLRECCLCSCGYDFYDWGYNEYKYCPNCGKKVDWSEDE